MPLRRIAAAGLAMTVSACTASDISIGMGPSGPVPSVDVPSVAYAPSMIAASPAATTLAAYPPEPIPGGSGSGASVRELPPATPRRPDPIQRAPSGSFDRIESSPLPAPVASNAASSAPDLPPARTERRARPSQVADLQPPPPPEAATTEAQDDPAPPRDQSIESSPERSAALAPQGQAGKTEVQFLPLIGLPQDKAEMLAGALSRSASQSNVTIRPGAGEKAGIRLKGYFSAFNDGTETTLVYVWDVIDRTDERIHRIEGKETIPGKTDDPWSVVSRETLNDVASRTMREASSVGSSNG